MKYIYIALLFTMLSSGASAGHPLMDRFDLDSDGTVTVEELNKAGCSVKESRYKAADKNSDGSLSKKEFLKAKNYLVTSRQCNMS
jgi:Ca2+-binding EF-hand superfamily protein